jgi:Tfp pilus assembly protein PilN
VRGTYANSRFALILRRWRNRFGISAPRVAVRAHLPWYWRVLGMLLILAVTLSLATWIYDAGRRFAGFERSETEEELDTLRAKTTQLEKELVHLRSQADASESKLQIEHTAQLQLSGQVKLLEEENARLKEDMSVYENLALADGQEGSISINQLRIEPSGGAGNAYRYRMLVALQGSKKDVEFKGNLQLTLNALQDGKNVMILLPSQAEANSQQYNISFKRFRHIQGTFLIPQGARIKNLEVRLLQGGVVKASKSVSL